MGKAWIWWLVLGVVALGVGGGIIALVVAQNASQTAQLGLDLAFIGAWRMREPMPVLGLMGIVAGAVAAPLVIWVVALRSRVASLKRQLSLHDGI